jgi:hypothetical protein
MNLVLYRNGQAIGPYTLFQMRQMLAAGQVLPNEWVGEVGKPGWFPAAELLRTPVAGPGSVRFGRAGSCSCCSCREYFGSGYSCSRSGCGHHYDDHW